MTDRLVPPRRCDCRLLHDGDAVIFDSAERPDTEWLRCSREAVVVVRR